MKKNNLLLVAAFFVISLATQAQTTWVSDKSHAKVQFSVTHLLVSETTGHFRKFEGTIVSPKADDFNGANIDFSIDVNSIDTDDENRDKHLKGSDFFDVAKYPTITFKSKSFTKVSDKGYKLVGTLTMHGVSKEVTFDVVYRGITKSPYGQTITGFKIVSSINRYDFNLKYNSALETGGVAIGENVDLLINLEFIKK